MTYLLQTTNLRLRVGDTLLEPLNLQCAAGEIWGIIGPNGAGKTTLLHTLAGLVPVGSGELLLAGHSIKHYKAKEIARLRGILLQTFHCPFNLSVRQYCITSRYPHLAYLEQPNVVDHQVIDEALAITELQHRSEQLLHTLSGGEQQRLAIAAVLAQTPRIFLLDEPVNHLDLRQQFRILNYFKTLATAQKTLICMSLHDINIAKHICTHLVMLHTNGKVLAGKRDLATTFNLTALYGHPIKEIKHADDSFLIPET